MFSTADFEYGDVPYPMGGTHLKIEFVSLNEVGDYFQYQRLGPTFGCALPGYSFIDDVFE